MKNSPRRRKAAATASAAHIKSNPIPDPSTSTTQPCPSIGEGWTMQTLPRKSFGGSSKHYFSPNGEKFTSLAAVRRHLDGAKSSVDVPAKNNNSAKKKMKGTVVSDEGNKWGGAGKAA